MDSTVQFRVHLSSSPFDNHVHAQLHHARVRLHLRGNPRNGFSPCVSVLADELALSELGFGHDGFLEHVTGIEPVAFCLGSKRSAD